MDQNSLMKKFEDQLKNPQISIQKALSWFRDNVKLLSGGLNANLLMTQKANRLRSRVGVGRMTLFFYQAKYRQTLPYYDKFPLVIVLKQYPDGFLGLNLHYLPIKQRLLILNAFYEFYKSRNIDWLDENIRLNNYVDYQMLTKLTNGAAKFYKPCVKRYLYKGNDERGGGIKSRFFVVEPIEWEKMLILPVERFVSEKKNQTKSVTSQSVQADSMKKANK